MIYSFLYMGFISITPKRAITFILHFLKCLHDYPGSFPGLTCGCVLSCVHVGAAQGFIRFDVVLGFEFLLLVSIYNLCLVVCIKIKYSYLQVYDY